MSEHKKPGCARGRVTIECGIAGHYELRIVQTAGPLLEHREASADICMTRGELQALRTMIDKMFPQQPGRVDMDLSGPRPSDGELIEPPIEVDGEKGD